MKRYEIRFLIALMLYFLICSFAFGNVGELDADYHNFIDLLERNGYKESDSKNLSMGTYRYSYISPDRDLMVITVGINLDDQLEMREESNIPSPGDNSELMWQAIDFIFTENSWRPGNYTLQMFELHTDLSKNKTYNLFYVISRNEDTGRLFINPYRIMFTDRINDDGSDYMEDVTVYWMYVFKYELTADNVSFFDNVGLLRRMLDKSNADNEEGKEYRTNVYVNKRSLNYAIDEVR